MNSLVGVLSTLVYTVMYIILFLLLIMIVLDLFCVISPSSKLFKGRVNLFSRSTSDIQKRGYSNIKKNILDFFKNGYKWRVLIVLLFCYLAFNGSIMRFFTWLIK